MDRKCLQIQNDRIVELNNKFFRTIEKLPIESLEIIATKLESFTRTTFEGFVKLKSLKIVSEQLEIIDEDSFRKLKSLQTLYLHLPNCLHLPKKLLWKLKQLEHLTLLIPRVEKLSLKFFKNQSKLIDLKLDEVCGCSLSFRKLRSLDMRSDIARIRSVTNFVLQSPHLSSLKWSHSDISKIPSKFWPQLNCIAVSDTNFLNYSFANLFERTKLRFLRAKNCIGTDLKTSYLTQNSNLKYLIMIRCRVANIDWDFWRFLPHLKILHLGRNLFVEICEIFSEHLVVLDLSQNFILQLHFKSFANLKCLQVLNLAHNRLPNLKLVMSPLANLRSLNLAVNRIAWIMYLVQTPSDYQLKSLNLRANKIRIITFDLLQQFKYLRILNLSANEIKYLPRQSLEKLVNLERLDLSGNRLVELESHIFDTLVQLKELKLANNCLVNINRCMFRKLRDLKVLDLSANHIYWLTRGLFEKNLRLRILLLNGNLFQRLPDDLFCYSFLEVVSLSLNRNDVCCGFAILNSLNRRCFFKLNC